MSELGRQQHKVETLKDQIRSIQEGAEELESAFPKDDDDKVLNNLSKKLTDRLSAAHDLSLKISVELGQRRIREFKDFLKEKDENGES